MKRYRLAILMWGAVLGVWNGGASAGAQTLPDTTTSLFELELDQLLNIEVVSASKVATKLSEAPGLLTSVGAQTIRQYGWLSLNELCWQQAGFNVSQDYDRRTIGFRGRFENWSNNRMLLLVDDVPFNENAYGTAYTWEITPLLHLNNVEVTRGPGSALYGSNAMNGVLNLQTVDATNSPERVEFSIRGGSRGTVFYDVLGVARTPRANFVALYSRYQTDGNTYMSPDGSGRTQPDGMPRQLEVQDQREGHYVFLKSQFTGKAEGLSFQYHHQQFEFQTGHGWLWHIPDKEEHMNQWRNVAVLRYRTPPRLGRKIVQEYVIRYQAGTLDWDTRLYANGVLPDYPYGLDERVRTTTHDVFTRVQYTLVPRAGHTVVAGTENTTWYYPGDRTHTASANLDTDFSTLPRGETKALPGYFSLVTNSPVYQGAVFGQYISPWLLGSRLQLTVGLRGDLMAARYRDFADTTRSEGVWTLKTWQQLSPRLAVVARLHPQLTAKLLVGRAFRTPAASEVFARSSFLLASNIRELRPENATGADLVLEYDPSQRFKVRLTGFVNRYDNEMGYGSQNLIANLYSTTTAGLEAEAEGHFRGFSGFANYTLAQRIHETVADPTITPSPDRTVWAPTHRFNVGTAYTDNRWQASVSGLFQGSVARRASDTENTPAGIRPAEVGAWFQLNARVAYRIRPWLECSLTGFNVLNADQYLVKVGAFPFDYRREKITLLGGLRVYLK